jgi:hypothetical protein
VILHGVFTKEEAGVMKAHIKAMLAVDAKKNDAYIDPSTGKVKDVSHTGIKV